MALQLADQDRLDPMIGALLNNLDLVAKSDFITLKQKIGASDEDLGDMLEEIRALNPRPGRAFDGSSMQAVVPDVYIRPGPDGGWLLELNSEVLPRVLVNRTYYSSVSKRTRDKKEKAFLVDCLQNANWLTKSLDQRAQTILKVATEIARMQDSFLLHGVTHLKPMTLKNVADAIEMHESTVSRITTNKYIATPRGLFEMKYFFTTALNSSSGESEHSSESVRHLIKQIVDAEDVKKILSDDKIAEILSRTHQIEVARRTIAKYREGLNIPSSVVRRRQKKSKMPGF
ncbi:RNA polymerase sigma-54 factor RpoN [hydrothermal vent metagenome]|uniref:RNA polymerase sigma-54 factor RpoN n=1 Tax=hydrothermal vent metagenome TaxID=652676 RepID=A0A3B0U041_9ZZZZ